VFRNIRWRIAIPYVLLIIAGTLAATLYLLGVVRDTYLADLRDQLTAEALLMADQAESLLAEGEDDDTLNALAGHWSALLDARVTIIRADGVVLGESDEDRTQMENHLYRPEVQQSLEAGQGSSIRFSRTVGYEMMYVAVSVTTEGRLTGFLRVALPLREIESNLSLLRRTIVLATLTGALLAVLLALWIAQRTARPIRQLTAVTQRLADGDLRARLFPSTRDEVGQLTTAFNDMADRLQGEMTALARERGRLAAVLNNMAGGVLITDEEGKVLLMNPAAGRILGVGEQEGLGWSIARVMRHHRLIELWQRCRESREEQVTLVEMDRQGPFVQAVITPLQADGQRGFLVILQDLTRTQQLERARRDFVSNVSHELRTPLASLKALVDTLRDGALDDPEAAQRFLDRIETEVDALTEMVQELLELSRIESGQVPVRLEPATLSDVVLPPVERLLPQAERAGLEVTVELPDDLPLVLADAERVRRVVSNLVHNAIKFTPSGGRVVVRAETAEEDVVISVRDNGVGISADDLGRIFERFYKADRARSGGGTGLGLAIAKHIVQAHGGRIWAESQEGQGSTLSFTLPAVGSEQTP
jgi:two-component system phosphate regulon sensor histidine kinase PhoR